METLNQPAWTLSVQLSADVLEFGLGDGRRFAVRSRLPAAQLQAAATELSADTLLGAELAARLTESPPRVLNIQLDARLDAIHWESLRLGPHRLGQYFIVTRQLMSETESVSPLQAPLTEVLTIAVLHQAAAAAQVLPQARQVALDALHQAKARETVQGSQVLVLDGVTPDEFLERVALPPHECLLVIAQPDALDSLAALLDLGATVLVLPQAIEHQTDLLHELMRQLSNGSSVGAVVRTIHRRAAPDQGNERPLLAARLYGNPALRFVHKPSPASRRQVTSLSFDLVGSTATLQRLGDEAYSEMLAGLHARATSIVRQHGGQPDDPQGDDGVMSYFGHPSAVEDAALHAVEAGLQLVRTVSELGVSVRVGIATGLVAVQSGQPVGLSIHMAARLQQVTAAGTVLIAAATQGLVADAFDLQALASHPELKGIEALEPLYLVLGPSQNAKLHRLERLQWLTPMVGRQAELARLGACWQEVRLGECRLALVRAEAGMGKSRLVREFRNQLTQSGVKVLECRCRADASGSPFLVLAEALKRWMGIDASDTGSAALHKLSDALLPAWRAGEPFDLLAALLGLAAPPQIAPARARQRLLTLLLEWFGTFAKAQTCCLIVEDWHWVDPSMREFVEQLVQATGGPGLLVVLTSRHEADPATTRWARCERIELVGLTVEAARELVSRVRADAPLPTNLIHLLAARGDGVPLFLEEATRMAYERGIDGLAADSAALAAVPASLHDVLMARLDGVGSAKSLAQVAAVLGREFSRAPLAALLETGRFAADAGALAEDLATLEASGLVRAEGGEHYAFKHALVRDAAYASLWARDRQALHAQMVTLLQQRWPALAARQPELLAHHQTEAGQHVEALAQWERAARNATARSAEVEAISHLRRALALLARSAPGPERDRTGLRLQLMLAARLIATEGYGAEAVGQAYLEAGRLCDVLGNETERFKVEMGLEGYRFMRADFDLALAHGRIAAAIAERSGDTKQRLHAHWGLACTLFHQGNLRATMRELELGLALYTPALHQLFGVQDPGVMCLAYSSWGLWEQARPDAAIARINHAVEIATEFEHKFSQAAALAYSVSIHLLRGETELALARADVCIAVCEEAGFPVWLAITRCMRGRLLCERGEFDIGLAEMRAGYALWLSTGSMVSQPLYLALQAEGLALAGQLGAAVACVDEGLAIASRYGERQYEAELRRLRGELALRRGDATEAEAWIKSGYALALRQHRHGFALRSATALARLWAADGRTAAARRLLPQLLARWGEGQATRDVRAATALCETLA